MPQRNGYLDWETRSKVPIQHGTDLYARSAQALICTWAYEGDGPVHIWDAYHDIQMPGALVSFLQDPSVNLTAHNAPFDRAITTHTLRFPTAIHRWRCTRAQAYSHGLPGSLELLGKVLGLPEDQQKLESGKRLIQLFCVPRANGEFTSPDERPAEWEEFCRYAVQDTAALREIHKRLPSHNYNGENLTLWALDQLINERGFHFDKQLATATVDFLRRAKDISDSVMSKASGKVVTAATQRERLLNHLQQKHHLDIPNMRAATIREYLEQDDLMPEVRLLLETRLEGGKSAASKFRRGLQVVGPRDRIRHGIQFNGAGRTGRFSGKGFQVHNTARPVLTVPGPDGRLIQIPMKAKFIDDVVIPGIYSGEALNNAMVYGGPNEAAALAVRHVITAAPGNELNVGDWSNIESRVVAWIANEVWKLEAYRAIDRGDPDAVDMYKLLFSQFFGIRIEDINDTGRQGGKVCELAFSFGGAVGALVTMAATYQMDLDVLAKLVLPRATPEQLKKAEKAWRRAFLKGEDYELEPATYKACDVLKQTYRASNACIDELRHDLDAATKGAIKEPGRSFKVGKCVIWCTGTWLTIQLPSGRRLLYANPKIEVESDTDPDTGKVSVWEYITYATARGQIWMRERAWSGLFLENIVQAIANDILRAALLRVHRATLAKPAVAAYLNTLPPQERTALALHVHDEIVVDLPVGLVKLDELIDWLTQETEWSAGLPLAAAGWTGFRYGKRG